MPTNSSSNQIALKLDYHTKVVDIIINTYDTIPIQKEESVIHIFDNSSHQTFYNQFSKTKDDKIVLGTRVTLSNKSSVMMFLLKQETAIIFFAIGLEEEMISLFDKMIKINNEQVRSIRDLYQKLTTKTKESAFYEEIMMINNSLVNIRRDLSNKNQQLNLLNEKLKRINFTDYLTQIPNRRKFFTDAYNVVQQESYFLIMMDFNNFKVVNNTLGHAKGDQLLQLFSSNMTDYIKPYNAMLYRLGGDEFAILCPSKMNLPLKKIINQIDNDITFIHSDVSIAYGSVTINQDNCNATSPIENHMRIADKQMYVNKEEYYQNKQ